MATKKLWIITSILLIGFIVIQCVFFLKPSIDLGMNQMNFSLPIFYNIISFLIFGAITGVLVALIPFKQKAFKEKVKKAIPISTSIIMGIYFIYFGYILYQVKTKGIELRPAMRYEDIKTPAKLDCSLVHEGKFEDDKCTFERTGEKQIQFIKKTGKKTEFTVTWTSDCEYVLTPVSDGLDRIRIKIISANASNYGCYVNDEKSGKMAFYDNIKRIK